MEKKYQIFISSTYKDLIEARSKVRDAILSMMHFPVGMEMFNAADEEQWEIIQETIDSSDYYVLILGQRYGSVIESGSDAGISYHLTPSIILEINKWRKETKKECKIVYTTHDYQLVCPSHGMFDVNMKPCERCLDSYTKCELLPQLHIVQ